MKLATICTACGKQRKSRNLLYHPETLQPYCANQADCVDTHPNCVYTVATRGNVVNLLTHKDASAELKKRVDHFIETNPLPYISKILHEYGGNRALSIKLPTQILTRLARYVEHAELQENISEAVRQLIVAGLNQFEARNMLEANIPVQPIPDNLPPITEPESSNEEQPEQQEPELKENGTIIKTGTPVPVPVRRVVEEPSIEQPEPNDEWVF